MGLEGEAGIELPVVIYIASWSDKESTQYLGDAETQSAMFGDDEMPMLLW